MNIGFDAKRAFHNYTGLGNYSRFIVKALDKHYPKNNYHLYTPNIRMNVETRSLQENFNIHQAPGYLQYSFLKAIWRYFLIAKDVKKLKLDIFHGLSNELPTYLKGVKKVVTIHDLIFLRYPDLFPPFDRRIYKYKFKKACQKADAIVAISHQTKRDIIEFFKIEESKVHVIYQGCHPNFLKHYSKEKHNEVQKKYNLPEKYLLYVGTLEKRKNALIILKALKAGKIKIPLVLIGRKTPYFNLIDNYILENKLQNQVIAITNVDFIDLPAIYDLSLLFIYPSIFEGFGIPIIEALQRNKPVITSKGSCFSEAGGNMAVYIDPENEYELADEIKKILNSEGLNESALKEHLLKFSEKVIADDYIKLYQKLI